MRYVRPDAVPPILQFPVTLLVASYIAQIVLFVDDDQVFSLSARDAVHPGLEQLLNGNATRRHIGKTDCREALECYRVL